MGLTMARSLEGNREGQESDEWADDDASKRMTTPPVNHSDEIIKEGYSPKKGSRGEPNRPLPNGPLPKNNKDSRPPPVTAPELPTPADVIPEVPSPSRAPQEEEKNELLSKDDQSAELKKSPPGTFEEFCEDLAVRKENSAPRDNAPRISLSGIAGRLS